MVFGSIKSYERRIIERVAADDENLEKVNMSGKRLDDDGMTRLSKALSCNTSITSLHLRNNNIGHKGIGALADALYQNLHVENIDLSGNNIGSEGATALAACLSDNNSSVISLDLQNNGIGNEGAVALLSAVSSNSAVHSINLEGNDIDNSLLAKIDEAVNRSKELFESEVVYFAPSPTNKDQDLAAVDTFSMTLSSSEGGDCSFDSSTDGVSVEVSNNYIFQEAAVPSPNNAELSRPSPLNAEGMAVNWVNVIGSFFHDDEKNKDVSEDSNVLRIIPASDDEGYEAFLAFLKDENMSDAKGDLDLAIVDTLSTASSRSESSSYSKSDDKVAIAAQQYSEETVTATAHPKEENPIEATLNWIGSLFHSDEKSKDANDQEKIKLIANPVVDGEGCDEEKKEISVNPVDDNEGYQEFLTFLKK